MKKILALIALTLVACSQDPALENLPTQQISNSLVITETQGLKLESYIVDKQVKINSKLATAGTYKIKIYDGYVSKHYRQFISIIYSKERRIDPYYY